MILLDTHIGVRWLVANDFGAQVSTFFLDNQL